MFNFQELKNSEKTYVIAEIGANHNGDMDLACKMIKSAKDCGADAAKFQSWDQSSLISREEYGRNQSYDDSKKKHFGSLDEMVERYYLRTEQHYELKEYCDEIGIDFCSTPFSEEEVDLLIDIGVPFIKVASCDVTHIPLLKYMARTGLPIILSTGMSELSEIDAAVRAMEEEGATEIILLHCISIYPPEIKDINLNNIPMLAQAFNHPVGLSDHSMGSMIPLAAVALGACVIEKHFTLDKTMDGWDHAMSANPEELTEICSGCEIIPVAMGTSYRSVSEVEKEKRLKFRRSIVTKRAMKSGEVVTIDDLSFKRPGTEISPELVDVVAGRTLKNDLQEDQLLKWNDFL